MSGKPPRKPQPSPKDNTPLSQTKQEFLKNELLNFMANPDIFEKSFPKLSKNERSYVHQIADEYGIKHRSFGGTNNRVLELVKMKAPMNPGKWDRDAKSWKTVDFSTLSTNELNTNKAALRVVTYNVLFDFSYTVDGRPSSSDFGTDNYGADMCFTEIRLPFLMQALENTEADIIALQEVTPEFLKWILLQEWVRQSYYVSDITGSTITPYGNLLLSKLPFKDIHLCHYKIEPKSFIVANFLINDQLQSFVNIHLKAGVFKTFGPTRVSQLNQIIGEQLFGICVEARNDNDNTTVSIPYDAPISTSHAFLVGDFNFKDWENETNPDLEKFYTDCWVYLHKDDVGFTYNLETNQLAKYISDKVSEKKGTTGYSSRFDRILAFPKITQLEENKARWVPNTIQMIGVEPVHTTPEGKLVWISDHFGLQADFLWL